MKVKQFYDLHHAQHYLTNSVIMIKGQPSFILDVTTEGKKDYNIFYYPIKNIPKEHKISINDEAIDMIPVKLGYVNYEIWGKNILLKVFRIPRRTWRIGLCDSNMRIIVEKEKINSRSVLCSSSLHNTICNIFPSLHEAAKLAEDKQTYVAFSRKFSIDKDGNIGFILLDEIVGKYDKLCKVIEIYNDYTFLTELLNQETIK